MRYVVDFVTIILALWSTLDDVRRASQDWPKFDILKELDYADNQIVKLYSDGAVC